MELLDNETRNNVNIVSLHALLITVVKLVVCATNSAHTCIDRNREIAIVGCWTGMGGWGGTSVQLDNGYDNSFARSCVLLHASNGEYLALYAAT